MTGVGEPDPKLLRLSGALLVEHKIRRCHKLADLHYELVNSTARVHEYELAFLCLVRGTGYRFVGASSVSQVDRSGPLGHWLEALAKRLQPPQGDPSVRLLKTTELQLPDTDWARGLPPCWLWLPLAGPTGGGVGVLILTRHAPWQESDRLLAEPLAGCYGHALWAMQGRLPRWLKFSRRQGLLAALFFCALAFTPVQLDTFAPAEIVASDPTPITAPFDGIVATIAVRPYQFVKTGDTLLSFDDRELAMKRDVAAKMLAIAEAELLSFRNQAFKDPDSKNKIALAEQNVALERENLSYAEARFDRHHVTSPQDGVALFDDRFGWQGRPVATGQTIMTLAKPEHKELKINIPVAGLIPSSPGADVRLFLDMDPSHPVAARLVRLGYEARPIPGGELAYHFVAAFVDDVTQLQLGARGIAKVYGEEVSLGYYLLRRPWAAVRRFLGV